MKDVLQQQLHDQMVLESVLREKFVHPTDGAGRSPSGESGVTTETHISPNRRVVRRVQRHGFDGALQSTNFE